MLSTVKVISEKVIRSYSDNRVLRKYVGSGSGFCYSFNNDKYLITNAHCVDSAIRITIYKQSSSKVFEADVVSIGYECDLAILQVKKKDTKEFYRDMEPIPAAGLPNKLDKVFAYGYPMGGLNVSITRGVISRISIVTYSKASDNITLQIDAAINFGNSGGPVLNANNELVGVAFSGEDDATSQNMGYIIPTFLLTHFLRHVKKYGQYQGNTGLSISVQEPTETMRSYYSIPKVSGVFVTYANPLGMAKSLQRGDFITKINNCVVFDNGTVALRDATEVSSNLADERVHMNSIVSLQIPGEHCFVDIIRDGKPQQIRLKVAITPLLVPVVPSQLKTKIFRIGDLTFAPASSMLIRERAKTYIYAIVEYAAMHQMSHSDEQVIILTDGPANHPVNAILKSVNNIAVRSLEHLQEIIKEQKTKSKYLVYNFVDSHDEIITGSFAPR